MTDRVYLLLEEHRYIKPRMFTIIAVYDCLETAMKEHDKYNVHIPCSEYPYEIKLEEWEVGDERE